LAIIPSLLNKFDSFHLHSSLNFLQITPESLEKFAPPNLAGIYAMAHGRWIVIHLDVDYWLTFFPVWKEQGEFLLQ
jgi:hypothetical protein